MFLQHISQTLTNKIKEVTYSHSTISLPPIQVGCPRGKQFKGWSQLGNIVNNLELQQMEDILQTVSNQHRTIYYAVELKIMDIKQRIKLKGMGLSSNEVKTSTAQMLNHFYMLQSIFQQSRIPHIYQLAKDINASFHSVIAVLLQKIDSQQKEYSLLLSTKVQEKGNAKNEQSWEGSNNRVYGSRKNRLGGVHLYNEDYTRYIQDQMILDQIKIEKERRLQRKRKDILRQSILDELNHQTDVEQFPANSDDIANYIIRTKDKDSVFNYVSYEPELQSILSFFQKSQNEANQFLLKKARTVEQDGFGNFSFADFHRDILMKNAAFRKQVGEKLKDFIAKYRNKQKDLEEYLANKEKEIKEQQMKVNRSDQGIQTDFSMAQFEQSYKQQVKQLEEKCLKLQTISRMSKGNQDKQSQLMNQISNKQTQIDKSNRKVAQLQTSLDYIKQLFKDEKLKKTFISRQESIQKSQKALPLLPNQQKEDDLKQRIAQKYSALPESALVKSNDGLRQTLSKTKYWKKNEVSDTASFVSFNEEQKNKRQYKGEKDIAVRYIITKKTEEEEEKQPSKDLYNSAKRKEEVNYNKYIANEVRTEEAQFEKQPPSQMLNTVSSFKNVKKSQKLIKLKTQKSNKTLKSQKQIKFDTKQTEPIPRQKAQQSSSTQKESCIGSTMISSELTSQPYIQKETVKDVYSMHEVTEQVDEQTAKQSENTSKDCSMKSLNNQKQLISKLNLQLKRIKEQHTLTFNHLFSISLNPKNKHNLVALKTQQQQIQKSKDLNQSKLMKAFDSFLKFEVNPAKVEKIKKWRRLMQNHIKSQSITPQQFGQIMCIIKGSAYNTNKAQNLQKVGSPLNNISPNIRNSLKQINLIANGSGKLRLPLLSNQKMLETQGKGQINTQIQQQIFSLIRQESLSKDFAFKFNRLHLNCCEGALCSHISSYLQKIMKHFEQKQKRERKSLILPIQRIGDLSRNEETGRQKQGKPLKGTSQHKQNNQSRKNYSLNFNRSQNSMLPNIGNNRASNYKAFNTVLI